MTRTVIFNDFKAVTPFRNRYRRSELEIWDANLHYGDVRPFACPVQACPGEVVSDTAMELYPLPECKCQHFEMLTDPHLGFCGDQHFFVSNGSLRQATSQELCDGLPSCLAGSPTQKQPPSGSSNCSGCDGVAMSYVVTYVTEHAGIQVESAPSPPSTPVASSGHIPGTSVSWAAAPPGYCVVATRLYRVESTFEDGESAPVPIIGSEFVLVAEFQGGGAGSFTDNVPTSQTGAPLTTYLPSAFPAPQGIKHLTRTEDGIAVADDHRVYISVPGQPQFAFDGVVEIENTVLGIESVRNTIFVFTDNYPVKLVYRITDGIMTIEKSTIRRRLPLKSKKSLSVYNDTVYFSSTYSLYGWDVNGYGSDITNEIQELITPEQWKNIDPETVTGTAYEFGYIFSSDEIDYSIMLEFGGDRTDTLNQTSFMPISYINGEAFATDYDGHIVYREGDKIYCWDWRKDICDFDIYDNTRATFCEECCPWKIKMYFDNEGKNRFSKMRVEWDKRTAPHLDAAFWHLAFGCEEKVADFEVISSRGFSIPKFSSSQTFVSEVSGCGIMHEIRFATSNQELVSNSNNLVGNPEQ